MPAPSDQDSSFEDVPPQASSGKRWQQKFRDKKQSVDEARSATIVDHILGDEPAATAKVDRLGFEPYVRAVTKFLTDESTKIPLTMSVEGVWGSGKSSFMLLLQNELRERGQKRIVAFNAWQYGSDEGLWAAFLNEFDSELRKSLTPWGRVVARARLLLLNLKWRDWLQTAKSVAWMVITLAVLAWMLLFLRHGGVKVLISAAESSGKWSEAVGKMLAVAGGAGGTAAAVLLFLAQFKELFKSPVTLGNTAKAWRKPDYSDRLPMIHKTIKEFQQLVRAYAGRDNVYIFVDDLDRCEHTQAAEVMQMLLTLLSNAPKVALILGVDRDKVAAAMAARQEKLLPYLYQTPSSDAFRLGIEYGHRFLEKFIQVNYVVPTPGMQGLRAMINPDVPVPVPPAVSQAESAATVEVVTGKDDSGTLNDIIDMAGEVFEYNPRNVKQFVNMFRLQAFIANETGLFVSSKVMKSAEDRLTIPQLAKFVALCMRWPSFVEASMDDTELLDDLELKGVLLPSSEEETEARYQKWLDKPGLMALLNYRAEDEEYQLSHVDLRALTTVAPARARNTLESAEVEPLPNPPVPPESPRPERSPVAVRARSRSRQGRSSNEKISNEPE